MLADQSQKLLAYKSEETRQAYLDAMRMERETPALSNVRLTCICKCFHQRLNHQSLATLKRNQQRPDASDVMVLGAEIGVIYWVDCQAFTVLEHFKLKNAPDKLLNLGLFDIEFRTFIITRTGEVIILKKTGRSTFAQTVFYLRSHPVDMAYSVNQARITMKWLIRLFSWCLRVETTGSCFIVYVANVWMRSKWTGK